METTRPILYGVSDYAELRKANAWFVDRTAHLRDLEATRFALFLRPRRFGKSLFISILQAYYDVAYASRFEELFAGTDIGENPTENHNKYLILYFNFSTVEKVSTRVQESFDGHVSRSIDAFARKYDALLPAGSGERILAATHSAAKLDALLQEIRGTGQDLYVLIDEYDNFTNTILAESGLAAYTDLCHGDGFFKQFFTNLKAATTSTDAPVKRIFITGVSPVTMDDVTSGFNIGTNISLHPAFADLTGFRHDDLHAIDQYYAQQCGFAPGRAEAIALEWFDNYRFAPEPDAPAIANTTQVLWLYNRLWQTRLFPERFIDENVRTDYAKLRHLLTLNRRLNGNFQTLERLVSGGRLEEPLVESFQALEVTRRENFTSLLFWFGITTITGTTFGKTIFGIPNETLKALTAQMLPDAYSDVHQIDERVYDINDGLVTFARCGDWHPLVETLCDVVRENFAVRDAKEGEVVVEATLVALLRAARGPYLVRHEGEANGGFYDLALAPMLAQWPDIAHAALIELKYLKSGEAPPASPQLEVIRQAAAEQLDRYAADPGLRQEWRLGEGDGKVRLHRIVLVFHGGECLLADSV